MKRFLLIFLLITSYVSFACHNTIIDNVATVDNGDGTYTFTIDLTVDVGSLDGRSLGFGLIFSGSSGTPTVLGGYTASLSRAGYNDLIGYTGANIGTGMGPSASNYFDDRYGGRTDVLTYETDDDYWGFGSTDYSRTVVVTVDGCVDEIYLDGDFRTTGSATPAGEASCIAQASPSVGLCTSCSISDLTVGVQTACNPATNTYTQEITVTYTDDPGTGTLNVNGQSFAITTSPQTVTLTGLNSDGNSVDVTAQFSDDLGCFRTETTLFTAPAACDICDISSITAGAQTACNVGTNTYTQEVTITYLNEPGSGTLDVNGQSFAITSSPQTVTLTGLVADGNSVDVTAEFSDESTCNFTESDLFVAPVSCNSCDITALAAGAQSACNPADNTYTQEVSVTYSNAPGAGTLDVNGQSFAITSSPQTVTLTGLTSDGGNVDITANFSAIPGCSFTQNNLFSAPTTCLLCDITAIAAGAQSACNPISNTYSQQVTITYENEPTTGNLIVNGATFSITGSPQTVTLTNLTSDGNAVDVTALFSTEGTCTRTENSLFTAPASCTGSSSSCDFTTTDAVIVIPNGDHNTGASFTQVYALTNTQGIIQATSANGNFGVMGFGRYYAFAINYETADPPSTLPAIGVDIADVTGGCSGVSASLVLNVCNSSTLNACENSGDDIVVALTPYNDDATYNQNIVIIDALSGTVLDITTPDANGEAVYSTNTVGGDLRWGNYIAYSVNYEDPETLATLGIVQGSPWPGSFGAKCVDVASANITVTAPASCIDGNSVLEACEDLNESITVFSSGYNGNYDYRQFVVIVDNTNTIVAVSFSNEDDNGVATFSTIDGGGGDLTLGTYKAYTIGFDSNDGDETYHGLFVGNSWPIDMSNCVDTSASAQVTIEDCGPLPLELLLFDGKKEGDSHLLEWEIVNFASISLIEVQYSSSEKDFETISKVLNDDNQFYNFNYNEGANYYRLRMIYDNGAVKYSNLVNINEKVKTPVYSVYPNPTSDYVFNISSSTKSVTDFILTDITGRVVYSNNLSFETASTNKIELSNDLPKGMYIASFQSQNENIQNIKLLIK